VIRSTPQSGAVDTDVCVIGTGAAGIAIARELDGTGIRVCLLESGHHKPAAVPDPYYEIISKKATVENHSRRRAFGGTTTVWAGRWRRFDPIDLEARDWVPSSGWPVNYDQLVPFYERAADSVHVRDHHTEDDLPDFMPSKILVPTVFHTLTPEQRRFGTASQRQFERSDNVDVMLGTHCMQLIRAGHSITHVVAKTEAGTVSIYAKHVILAAGGIENARQLLLSKIGNQHDQVGRYFMDHPKGGVGVIETYEPIDMSSWKGLTEDAPIYVGFRLADEVQRQQQTLNSYVFLAPMFQRDLVSRAVRRLLRPKSCRMLLVRNYMEQIPDPENRVYLGEASDPYGQPRAAVAWQLGEQDRTAVITLHRMLQREVRRAGVGELVSPLLHQNADFSTFVDASHHMGTTRMGRSPRNSVVDADCRVHDCDNLFVAGSSVFPTSGYANPTATIVALAIRLADHVKGLHVTP
jgi:choline dehydrogenase-like flavoprotein